MSKGFKVILSPGFFSGGATWLGGVSSGAFINAAFP
jgi:hypothetical protein